MPLSARLFVLVVASVASLSACGPNANGGALATAASGPSGSSAPGSTVGGSGPRGNSCSFLPTAVGELDGLGKLGESAHDEAALVMYSSDPEGLVPDLVVSVGCAFGEPSTAGAGSIPGSMAERPDIAAALPVGWRVFTVKGASPGQLIGVIQDGGLELIVSVTWRSSEAAGADALARAASKLG